MAEITFKKQLTAVLVIDRYNDFPSEGGKVWPRIRAMTEANGRVPHILGTQTVALSHS